MLVPVQDRDILESPLTTVRASNVRSCFAGMKERAKDKPTIAIEALNTL